MVKYYPPPPLPPPPPLDIMSLTWDEWSYPEGVIFPIVNLGTIRPEDSGAARNATEHVWG